MKRAKPDLEGANRRIPANQIPRRREGGASLHSCPGPVPRYHKPTPPHIIPIVEGSFSYIFGFRRPFRSKMTSNGPGWGEVDRHGSGWFVTVLRTAAHYAPSQGRERDKAGLRPASKNVPAAHKKQRKGGKKKR